MPKTTKPDVVEIDRLHQEAERLGREYLSAMFEKQEAATRASRLFKESGKAHADYMRARAAVAVPEQEKEDEYTNEPL